MAFDVTVFHQNCYRFFCCVNFSIPFTEHTIVLFPDNSTEDEIEKPRKKSKKKKQQEESVDPNEVGVVVSETNKQEVEEENLEAEAPRAKKRHKKHSRQPSETAVELSEINSNSSKSRKSVRWTDEHDGTELVVEHPALTYNRKELSYAPKSRIRFGIWSPLQKKIMIGCAIVLLIILIVLFIVVFVVVKPSSSSPSAPTAPPVAPPHAPPFQFTPH